VLARPLVANTDLNGALKAAGLSLVRIGDAASPGQVKEAVAAGFQAGMGT
jgi:hypothetical protein